jgi:hypothetical protein
MFILGMPVRVYVDYPTVDILSPISMNFNRNLS